MVRRSEHSPEELKALIIGASEKIISTEGLIALSAREIARSVGYSPGTIYNIFQNLDDLILQIEARLLDDLDARLSQLPRSADGTSEVRALAQEYLAFTAERPRLWNILFEHRLPNTVEIPKWYQTKLDALMQHVENALKPVMHGMDATQSARSARVLWASVHGITSLATMDKLSTVTSESAQTMMDDLVETYLAGLQGLPASKAGHESIISVA